MPLVPTGKGIECLAPASDAFQVIHQRGVRFFMLRQFAVVQLQDTRRFDLFAQIVVGRHDDIEARATGEQARTSTMES